MTQTALVACIIFTHLFIGASTNYNSSLTVNGNGKVGGSVAVSSNKNPVKQVVKEVQKAPKEVKKVVKKIKKLKF